MPLLVLSLGLAGCHFVWPFSSAEPDPDGRARLADVAPGDVRLQPADLAPGDLVPALRPCKARYPAALVCDDFEQSDLSATWDFVRLGPPGTTSLSAGPAPGRPAKAGQGALAVHLNGSQFPAEVVHQLKAMQPTDSYFLRAFLYLPDATAKILSNQPGSVPFLELESPSSPQVTASVDISASDHGSALVIIQPGVSLKSSYASFPVDTWVCVELHAILGPNGRAEYWVDDQLAAAFGGDPFPPPSNQAIDVLVGGYQYVQSPAGPIELFLDEVVLSTTKVGCGLGS